MLSKKEIEIIFREHYKDLLNYAYVYVGNLQNAEEVVQDVFLSVWEQRNNIKIDSSLKNYLLRAIKNKSLNYKTRYINKNNNYTDIENASSIFVDDQLPIGNDLIRQLRISIKELPEQCRRVFLLSRFTSLTYPDIAKHLEISVKTVESHMSLALKKLAHSILVFK
jgi:RNA polymerase sigma-70 factor, ECF subfamily